MEPSTPSNDNPLMTKDWTSTNRWRKVGVWVATITTLVVAISLATLPLFNYTANWDHRDAWIWGWSDTSFSYWKWFWEFPPASSYSDYTGEYTVYTDGFYPAAIWAMIFGAFNLLIYLGQFLYLRGKLRTDSVGVVRALTGWTWIWGIGIMIGSAAANNTGAQMILGIPNMNAWITFCAGFVLSGACWIIKPTEEEITELQARIKWLKGEISNFFTRSGFPSTIAAVKNLIDRGREIGARQIRKEVQTYSEFLPKLWGIHHAFSEFPQIDLYVLRKQFGMDENDFSKYILGIAKQFNLTINGDKLISRPDIDKDQLMKTSERLLKIWEEDVRKRQAAAG